MVVLTYLILYAICGALTAAFAVRTTKQLGSFGTGWTLVIVIAWPLVVITILATVGLDTLYSAIERVRK